jgi:hypothetical protein
MKINQNFVFALVMTVLLSSLLSLLGQVVPIRGYLLIFLISYPYEIKENVWSLFGGFSEKGSVYSFFGVYQKAERDAFQIVGLCLYQKAGNDAFQGAGLCLYQKAERDAFQVVGLCLYQKAGSDAFQFIGLCLYQKAGSDAFQFIGLCLYQKAARVTNHTLSISVVRETQQEEVA